MPKAQSVLCSLVGWQGHAHALFLVAKWYLSSGRFTKCFSKQASGLVPCNEAIFLTWPRLGLPS